MVYMLRAFRQVIPTDDGARGEKVSVPSVGQRLVVPILLASRVTVPP